MVVITALCTGYGICSYPLAKYSILSRGIIDSVIVAEESLKKRWKSFRNAFLREEVMRLTEDQEEPGARKPYQFYESLLFLKPFIRSFDVESNPTSSKKLKRKVTQLEEGEDDPDRMFMMAMMNELKKVIYDVINYIYIQGGTKVLHQKKSTGRAGCREQYEVGYPCPEMNTNAAMGTFLQKLGNAATQAIPCHSFCISCERQIH